MEIRILTMEELPKAVSLANGVFDYCLKNYIQDRQTVEYFFGYANEENIRKLVQEGRLILWGGFEKNNLVAMSGMQKEGHITMLYVLPLFQRRDWGKELLLEMRSYAKKELHLEHVTLNAVPARTSGYFAKQKFQSINLPNPMAPYIPMQAKAVKKVSYEKKPVPAGWAIGTSVGAVVLSAIVAVGFILSYMHGMN